MRMPPTLPGDDQPSQDVLDIATTLIGFDTPSRNSNLGLS